MVELVRNRSPTYIAKNRALEQVRKAIIRLTGNLLRVTRGAGKGYEIAGQAAELVKTLAAYQDAAGHLPNDYEISRMIDWRAAQPAWRRGTPMSVERCSTLKSR